MLEDILEKRKCFKLICGAENEDASEVEKLVALYSKAGGCLFDISANPEIVDAAKRGLEKSGIKNDRYLCVSIGTKGDPHISKAYINKKKCIKCGACANVCPQNTIFENEKHFEVSSPRCIGCGKCLDICPTNSINIRYETKNFEEMLPPLIEKGIECIEFHISSEDEEEVFNKWDYLQKNFKGYLSICINRSKCSDEEIRHRILNMIKNKRPYTYMLQADGIPMSGGLDNYNSTLQAVAMADMIDQSNLPVYLLMSGGTNSKSTELAKMCGVSLNGISMGSYARKIVREYIEQPDFLENDEIFNKALTIAKQLVEVSLSYL